MVMKVAIYARVSTDQQTVENQIRELHDVGERLGWVIVGVFTDEGISGAKGREKRPGLDRLLKGVARKEFDMVAAWAVDRLGRSLRDLVGFLDEIHERDVDLYLHTQGLDTSTAAGRAMFGMLSVFSDFERSIIRTRVKAGLNRAVSQGKRLGRPPHAPSQVRRAKEELLKGTGVRPTSRKTGLSPASVQRVKNQLVKSGALSVLLVALIFALPNNGYAGSLGKAYWYDSMITEDWKA